MIGGGSIKSKVHKIFKGIQTAWKKVLEQAVNEPTPFIGMTVSARTENPKVGQATTDFLKSISGVKVSSPTDMHRHGLILKVM